MLNRSHNRGNSILTSLTKVISGAIVFLFLHTASSQKYPREPRPNAMAQFVLKIAQLIHIMETSSSQSKCYFLMVSVPDYGPWCYVYLLSLVYWHLNITFHIFHVREKENFCRKMSRFNWKIHTQPKGSLKKSA